MKAWDLTTGASRLETALRALQNANSDVMEYWDDAAHRRFHEQHLKQVEPLVRKTLDVIRRMEQLLSKAQRECGTD